MLRNVFMACLLLLILHCSGQAQPTNDQKEIEQTALDFIEGWYEGNGNRMEASLHPKMLSKSVIHFDGKEELLQFSALELVQMTRNGGGMAVDKSNQKKEVIILDVYDNSASVKVIAYDAVEYLHLAKWQGKWKIINILFELYENENE